MNKLSIAEKFADRVRKPHKGIPEEKTVRFDILKFCREYIAKHKLVPPMQDDIIEQHVKILVDQNTIDQAYFEFITVLFNNELWRDRLSEVPFERRLLLIPKCLRLESKCPATFDAFGLLCEDCGLCPIEDLQIEAEKLGYVVLVAEGSALVMKMIQTGKIEAIVGVSCISVLKRAFPFMQNANVPGIAIPLLQDDCKNTTVDLEWVEEIIRLKKNLTQSKYKINELHDNVKKWFNREYLNEKIFQSHTNPASHLIDQLLVDGKRWRPFLTAGVACALDKSIDLNDNPELQAAALAVECFHKASLIHDDIEDEDDYRYGTETLHKKIVIGSAINIGDLMIGEGYRLYANLKIKNNAITQMIQIASESHCNLSLGQGDELAWRDKPGYMSIEAIIDVFSKKTSPAFDVALRTGAVFTGLSKPQCKHLKQFSDFLGIAYQIKDDIDDCTIGNEGCDLRHDRPSLALSYVWDTCEPEERKELLAWWNKNDNDEKILELIAKYGIIEKMNQLQNEYLLKAQKSISKLKSKELQNFLHKVLDKIFTTIEIKGWCHEFEATNASSSNTRSANTG